MACMNTTAFQLLTRVALSAALLALVGCKKDAPAEPAKTTPSKTGAATTGGPTTDGPATGQPVVGQPADPKTPVDPTKTGEVKANPNPNPAPKKVPDPRLFKVADLPEAPDNNIIMVARAAANSCSTAASDTPCPADLALAAKIQTEVEATQKLMAEGTDQEKRAIRSALLYTVDPAVDSLLATLVVAQNGDLDTAVVNRLIQLRSESAIAPLAAFLAKAKGQAILKAVDALGRLGLPKAVDVLVQNRDWSSCRRT
jgi:hypothetical protein